MGAPAPRAWAALAVVVLAGPAGAAAQPVEYDRDRLERERPAQMRQPPGEAGNDFLRAGRRIYDRRCAGCHGITGAGDGPAADAMVPRPRNFTVGSYELRTTRSGQLPLDSDLFRSISRGVPGTAMPAWGEGIYRLTELERWQVVYYLKSLAPIFWEEWTDPYRTVAEGDEAVAVELPDPPASSRELIARGRRLYLDDSGPACARCHGVEGRGDGVAAAEQVYDTGEPIRPTDFTNPGRRKNGDGPEGIFRTLSTGLDGAPMPGFVEGVSVEDRWAVALFVDSLREERVADDGPVVARRIEGRLPSGPDDAAWARCGRTGIPLMGQLIATPRWQSPAVDFVRICAVYNDEAIAIFAEWNDPFRDTEAGPREAAEAPVEDAPTSGPSGRRPTYVTGPQMRARAAARKIPDRFALHLPAGRRDPGQVDRPHMLMGDADHPIQAWIWSALGEGEVSEGVATGPAVDYRAQAGGSVQLTGRARYRAGRWRLMLTRPLTTPDPTEDAQLGPGDLVPFTVRIWDGRNGEEGLQSAMSSWRVLYLEAPPPIGAYVWGGIATVLSYGVLGFGFWRIRRSRPGGAGVSSTGGPP